MGLSIGHGIGIPFKKNSISWNRYCTPQNLVATATKDTDIVLTWDAEGDADSYKIYYGTDGIIFGSSTTSATNSKTVNGLTAGTKYYFKVVSVRGAEESNASDIKDATTFIAYYVRPAGGNYGDEDGSSYANAWNGFADITWASLGAGKVLYICGTHNEILTVGASGTSTAHLVLRGDYTGDEAIIDGTDTLLKCITCGNDYVEFHRLTLCNATASCWESTTGHKWVFDSEVYGSGDQNFQCNGDSIIVATRVNTHDAVDDGFSMHGTADVTIINSTITACGMGIQASPGKKLTIIATSITSCVVYIDGSCSDGIFISRSYIAGPISSTYGLSIDYSIIDARLMISANTSMLICNANLTIDNCTFIGGGKGDVRVSNVASVYLFRNCIFHDWYRFTYNVTGGSCSAINCNFYSLGIKSVSPNTGEIGGDPLLVDIPGNDFTLQALSPCREVGVTGLGYTEDYAGNPVPLTGVDIGCYQSS